MALPPQGMNDHDYEAIEAAVTETVRGRWFLNEFARRNRTGELRQILNAMTRLEGAVVSGQTALPPADPSVRLLMQRVKEIAVQLGSLSDDMRAAGTEESFARAVEEQGRAVAGLLRGPALMSKAVAPAKPAPPTKDASPPKAAAQSVAPRLPQPASSRPAVQPAVDPRLRILDDLDRLPLAEKLALFA